MDPASVEERKGALPQGDQAKQKNKIKYPTVVIMANWCSRIFYFALLLVIRCFFLFKMWNCTWKAGIIHHNLTPLSPFLTFKAHFQGLYIPQTTWPFSDVAVVNAVIGSLPTEMQSRMLKVWLMDTYLKKRVCSTMVSESCICCVAWI